PAREREIVLLLRWNPNAIARFQIEPKPSERAGARKEKRCEWELLHQGRKDKAGGRSGRRPRSRRKVGTIGSVLPMPVALTIAARLESRFREGKRRRRRTSRLSAGREAEDGKDLTQWEVWFEAKPWLLTQYPVLPRLISRSFSSS